MPDRPVVLNNTPLVAFWVLGRFDLLRDLFGEVLIPAAVEAEFLAVEETQRRKALEQALWIKTAALSHPRRALAYAELDLGEAEVLALAEERDARLVIIDERKGRRYAERMGLPRTGTLGVLLLAKEAGLINSVAAWIAKLQEAGLFLSPALVEKALEIAGEAS
jgi:predicted nucleic acid-binding protein